MPAVQSAFLVVPTLPSVDTIPEAFSDPASQESQYHHIATAGLTHAALTLASTVTALSKMLSPVCGGWNQTRAA